MCVRDSKNGVSVIKCVQCLFACLMVNETDHIAAVGGTEIVVRVTNEDPGNLIAAVVQIKD